MEFTVPWFRLGDEGSRGCAANDERSSTKAVGTRVPGEDDLAAVNWVGRHVRSRPVSLFWSWSHVVEQIPVGPFTKTATVQSGAKDRLALLVLTLLVGPGGIRTRDLLNAIALPSVLLPVLWHDKIPSLQHLARRTGYDRKTTYWDRMKAGGRYGMLALRISPSPWAFGPWRVVHTGPKPKDGWSGPSAISAKASGAALSLRTQSQGQCLDIAKPALQ